METKDIRNIIEKMAYNASVSLPCKNAANFRKLFPRLCDMNRAIDLWQTIKEKI